VAPDEADTALAALRAHPLGADAAPIGEIAADPEGLVVLLTSFGGTRIVDMLVGDPLPRIC
jgi:hydrogenase expression/formation protein HypE